MAEIKWVVFDLGGVALYHNRLGTYRVLAELLGKTIEEVFHWVEKDAELYAGISTKPITNKELHSMLGKRYGKELSEDEVLEFINGELIAPIPETVQLIKDLKKNNYKTACLSNTCTPHWDWLLKNCSFMQLFDLRMASQEMGLAKPDLAIYNRAVELMGTSPSQCVFFDDRAENVDAAIKAGWRAYVVKTSKDIFDGLEKENIKFH